MQVKLEKEYPIPANMDACWHILRDVEQLAGCMPGAEITERVDEKNYVGLVKVKVGPATAAFTGKIELLGFDEAGKSIRLMGKGVDKSGSTASMDLTASVRAGATPGECMLIGTSDVIINGKFAQFGGRMMNSVSDMILQQFADNFSAKAQAVYGQANPASAQAQATAQHSPKVHKELNAFAIMWVVIKDFFSNLFGAKK